MRSALPAVLLVLAACKEREEAAPPPPPPPLSPPASQAQPLANCLGVELRPEEVTCTQASACEPVLGVCGSCYRAANRLHAPNVRARVKVKNMQVSCKREAPPTPKIGCIDKTCQVIGYEAAPAAACSHRAGVIRHLINQSRACKQDDDCVLKPYGCPFGCVTPLARTADLAELGARVERYRQACPPCEVKCPAGGFGVVCRGGLCTSHRAQ